MCLFFIRIRALQRKKLTCVIERLSKNRLSDFSSRDYFTYLNATAYSVL